MKFLFVHQNFPGQYLHVLRRLAASGRHEILFLTEANQNRIAGVRTLAYRVARLPSAATHTDAREFEAAMLRAEAVALAAREIARLGLVPDLIIGHHGWGEMLHLRDVWPGVPMLGYFEFYYRVEGLDVGFDPEFPVPASRYPQIRAKNAINHLALALEGAGQTPTRFQRGTYPSWAQPMLRRIPEGADLALCAPDPAARRRRLVVGAMQVAPRDTLLTYVARGLEPYRGFHTLMRALPAMLRARPDLRVAIVGGDETSYGAPPDGVSWRETLLMELRGQLDLARVFFLGRIEYEPFRRLLQRSDLHIYLTYPFVASWSLREALGMGCAVLGSDTAPVREFITPGHNGLLVRFPDPAALAEAALGALADPGLRARLRANARNEAEAHLDLALHYAALGAEIARLTGQFPAELSEG